jgi:hypothetical protein
VGVLSDDEDKKKSEMIVPEMEKSVELSPEATVAKTMAGAGILGNLMGAQA